MIINRNINPERDLYYLGAKVIDLLSNTRSAEVDFFDLYYEMKGKEQITLNLFSLVLDWLFVIGVIKNGAKGKLIKCF